MLHSRIAVKLMTAWSMGLYTYHMTGLGFLDFEICVLKKSKCPSDSECYGCQGMDDVENGL